MAKTNTITKTRSIDEIAQQYAVATVDATDELALLQCRLAYEYVGATEGKEAAELRKDFAAVVTREMAAARNLEPGSVAYRLALAIPGDKPGAISVTEQAITYRVTAWKYMLSAGVTPTGPVATAAYALANAQVKDKDATFVTPAIELIASDDTVDPAEVFKEAAAAVREQAKKNQKARGKGITLDENITVDSIVAVLGLIPAAWAKASLEDKNRIADALAKATTATAE